ncbi:hypothetical protein B9Z65_8199 [Elsinoe australis]|uniref:Uncharacterized protein n=1 Tax=Elsinoe australis TaxID=40998 RepID=A0A2P7YWB8_9PEZI|nr:hypothetical protein B9Z65_8199 [Elsinoe australis]
MGSSKLAAPPKQQNRDDPRPDSSSAVSLHSIEAIDDDDDAPPPYTDEAEEPGDHIPPTSSFNQNEVARSRTIKFFESNAHPPIPSSRADTSNRTIWTYHEPFSSSYLDLEEVLLDQARFPPLYQVQISGSHKETTRSGNSERKEHVNDFDFSINLTHLLHHRIGDAAPVVDSRIQLVKPAKRAFRGGVFPSTTPHFDFDEEREVGLRGEVLQEWCKLFCNDKSPWKSFTFKRKIAGHNQQRVRELVVTAIKATGYLGHIQVSFSTQQDEIVFFSPGRVNTLRTIVWVRWLFYLTFLWLISWPVLFFMTKKYDVVHAVSAYRHVTGRPTVQDEGEWFAMWESAIQRAAYGRKQGCLDDQYRRDMEQADARGRAEARAGPITTGNAAMDGFANVVGMGLNFLNDRSGARGWGGDC